MLHIALLFLILEAESFTPNCIPENQFKFYQFPIKGCSEYFSQKCKYHPNGFIKALGDVSLVKIMETEILPSCAFANDENLKTIYGVNSKIKVLSTKAFVNLPNLEAIYLTFNSIREVRSDVFKNISMKVLDLSWNKLIYIDSKAFAQVQNLQHLNLSRNSLVTLPANSLPNTLHHLNLAYNLLTRVALNSRNYYNLTNVDLSNNLLDKVAILFTYPVKVIDLTNNRLQDFDYIDIASVDLVLIGGNQFEREPKYMENLNAKEIHIYPNPWKCDDLRLFWDTLISLNILLARHSATNATLPAECSVEGKHAMLKFRLNACSEDHQCGEYMVCRTQKCVDPCDHSLCHTSSFCETRNHQFQCSCQPNWLSDPLDIHGACQKVECFTNAHCEDGLVCVDNKCSFIYHQAALSTTPHPSSILISAGSEYPKDVPWWYDEIPRVTVPGYHGYQENLSSAVGHPADIFASWERFGIEFMLTFLVVFSYFVSMDTYRKWIGTGSITIGATYCSCTFVFMPYLNPARALGPSFVLNKWEAHWVDWLGPLLGGVASGLSYEYIFNPNRLRKPKKEREEEVSSIPSDDDLNYDDLDKPQPPKFHGSTYNTYRSTTGIEARSNYCPSLFSAPPARLERVESIYGGTKSLCRSPPLTRANLNRSQSVYTKSNTTINRELLPKPGPLVPAQSLYPMRLNQQNHLQNQNVHNQMQQRSDQIYGVRGVTPGTSSNRSDNYGTTERQQGRENYTTNERPRRDNYATTENPYGTRNNPPSSSDSSDNNPPPPRTRRPESVYAMLGSQARNLQQKPTAGQYPENRNVVGSASQNRPTQTNQLLSTNTNSTTFHHQHSPNPQY